MPTVVILSDWYEPPPATAGAAPLIVLGDFGPSCFSVCHFREPDMTEMAHVRGGCGVWFLGLAILAGAAVFFFSSTDQGKRLWRDIAENNPVGGGARHDKE